jgi:hypothetical protein
VPRSRSQARRVRGRPCYDEAYSEIIAKLSIWAALQPEQAGGGQLFHVADSGKASSKNDPWPAVIT